VRRGSSRDNIGAGDKSITVSGAIMVSSVQEHAVAAQSGAKPPSDELMQREIKYFRDFSAIYTDAIRSSDFKANIALLFLPLLMVPILSAHERGLEHVPLWVILAPFLIAYFFLILAIFPRYFRSEKSSFHLSRTAGPHHFTFTHDPVVELDEVRHRVALLSRILWWKTLYLRLSLGICLIGIPAFGISLAVLGM
jgi:Family of unknown function (DUF5706)